MHPFIRVAAPDDVVPVAGAMRVKDVEEIYAASGETPLRALSEAVAHSTHAWTICDADGPFAVFGAAPLVGSTGSPWFLATDRMEMHRHLFLAVAPRYIKLMQESYPILLNYVDARHTDSLLWLRLMGFRFTGFRPQYGFERRPFFQFSKVSSCAPH